MPNIFDRFDDDDFSGTYQEARQLAEEYYSPETQAFLSMGVMESGVSTEKVSKSKPEEEKWRLPAGQEKISPEMAEQTALEEPFLDPSAAFAGGAGGAGAMAVKQGMKLMPSLSKALLSGIVGGAADYPIGAVTEEVIEPEFPALAMPFNVLTGMMSGITLERAIEEGVTKGLRKIGSAIEPDMVKGLVEDMKVKLADETGAIKLVKDPVGQEVITNINKAFETEHIQGAAITMKDGTVYRGQTHTEAFEQIPVQEQKNILDADAFITSKGTVLTRDEAVNLTGAKGEDATDVLGRNLKPIEEKAIETIKADLPDTAEDLPKYLGNINQTRLDTPDKIKQLINLNTEQFKKQIEVARRGKRTWEQTERASKQYTLEDLLGRKPGEAYNPEQTQNARHLLVTSSENLHELRELIKTGKATDEQKLEFMKAFQLHYAILTQVSGIAAEAGRTLNILRKSAGASVGSLRQIKEITEQFPASPEKLAEALDYMDDPIKTSNFVRNASRATTKDMFVEAWINGILSGPQTHMINILSNSLNAVWQVPERFLAGVLGRVIPGEQVIKEREAVEQAFGLIHGFKDGLKAFSKALKTGVPADQMSKLEAARHKAITAGNIRQLPLIKKLSPNALQEGGVAAQAVDLLGEGIRLPGRFLTAEDEFFKGIGYRMELHAQAYRTAMQEGLKGEEAAKRIEQIISDPEKYAPNVHLAAIDAARYQTFTRPLEERILGALSASKNPIVKLIVPFVRTPTNILKFAGERTPLAPLSQKIRADIAAGGARRDLALARMSMGSMIMASAVALAAEGYITGGGPKGQQSNLRRQGWQPYSIKVGDKYIQFGRLEPLGMLFGLAADFAEITGMAGEELETERKSLASAVVMSLSKNVTSKTWLKGLANVIEALENPDMFGEKYIQRFVQTFIPMTSLTGTIERTIDPEMEAVWSISDSLRARIPGLSGSLPPKRDFWGKPITVQMGEGKRSWGEIAYSFVSPIYLSEAKDSPIDKEMTRLKMAVPQHRRVQSFFGVPIELTPQELDEFVTIMNTVPLQGRKNLKESLDGLTANHLYQRMSDDTKEDKIRDYITVARKIAKRKFLNKHPEIKIAIGEWQKIQAQGQ